MKRRWQGYAVIAVVRMLALLPLPAAHLLGNVIGTLMLWVPNSSRRIADRNLRLCFPQLSDADHRRLLAGTLRESAKTLTEMGAMWVWPKARLLRKLDGVSGMHHWQACLDRGAGIIALTPHQGSWEFMGAFALTRAPMTSLYRPPHIPLLEAFLLKRRARVGQALAPASAGGVKMLFKALQRGEMVGILPDQDPGTAGVFAPFFGIQANTMTLVQKLARKTGAAAMIAYARRLPWGRGYHVHFHPVDAAALADPDPVRAAATVNTAVALCACETPMQYQWTYKRFKRRPPGAARVY